MLLSAVLSQSSPSISSPEQGPDGLGNVKHNLLYSVQKIVFRIRDELQIKQCSDVK